MHRPSHPSTSLPRPTPLRRWFTILRRFASVATITSAVLLALSSAAGAVSVTPVAPPGAVAIQDLLNWTMYIGAAACTGAGLYGWAKMAFSNNSQSIHGSNHGKAMVLLAFGGAIGLGLTPTVINALTAIH